MIEQEIVSVSNSGKILGKIRAEIEKERKLKRPEYSIRAYEVHAPWLGQIKLFDGLVNDYNNGSQLFIIREPYGRINHQDNSAYLLHKLTFLLNFGAKLKDLESFKQNCIWDGSKSKDQLEMAKEWNRYGKLPEGKVAPEMYAAIMFDKAQVYGAVDERIAQILNQNLVTNEFPVGRIQTVLIEKAFANTISIMDETGIKKSIAVVDLHWVSYYRREAKLRDIEFISINCAH